jgi:hypothetical protein
MSANSAEVQVKSGTSVAELKRAFQQTAQFLSDDFWLVWEGKVLEDDRQLNSYGINSDIVLTAISKTPKVPQDNPFIKAPVVTPAAQPVSNLGATEGQDLDQKATLEHRESKSFGASLQSPATALKSDTPVVI